MVDCDESSEPVLGAKLDVESSAPKVVAVFRAAQGDCAVTDPAPLKALAVPGEHGLAFKRVAGLDSDLLDGTMVNSRGRAVAAVAKDEHGHGHDHALLRLPDRQRSPQDLARTLIQAQEQAMRLIAGLSMVSLAMVFLVLYSRYQSVVLAGIIMANIPRALIGSEVAMWLAGVSLSVASMVGFITLSGIATRNGILKISHCINLCKFEGERFTQSMVVRGSLERLTPVLMTALVAAFALTPLLLAADAPGKEPVRRTLQGD